MDGTKPGLVDLGSLRWQAEQTSKQCLSIAYASALVLRLYPVRTLVLTFFSDKTTDVEEPNKPFPLPLSFGGDVSS